MEQSLLCNLPFNLNGEDKLVRFTYTNWNSNTLGIPPFKNKTAKPVNIIIKDKNIKTVNSIQELVLVLGVKSRNTLFKYMNHVKGFYSPNLKKIVNIRYPYTDNLLMHEIIHRKVKQKSTLIIPNVSLFDLIPNILYVYNSNFSLYCIYKSIVEAARLLNPNSKDIGISLRGRDIAIGRGKNKEELVYNELGSFYFAENPNINRWKIYQKGKYLLILKDQIDNSSKYFSGIRPAQKYLLEPLNKKTRL